MEILSTKQFVKSLTETEKEILFRRIMFNIVKRNNLATPEQLQRLEEIINNDEKHYPHLVYENYTHKGG